MPVTIPFPDLAVRTMDEKLRALIPGNFTATLDCFPLGVIGAADPLGTAAPNSPSIMVGNNVMRTFIAHDANPFSTKTIDLNRGIHAPVPAATGCRPSTTKRQAS